MDGDSPTSRAAGSDPSISAFPGFGAIADDPGQLIDRLVAVRRQRGLSQTEVAARMGTSQSALARLESGQSDARLSTIVRLATALGVDVGFSVRSRAEGGSQP
jgi:ribosome-binding protein aMBF1 (putative translation factor)